MKLNYLLNLLIFVPLLVMAGPVDHVAFLREQHVFLADSAGKTLSKLDNDPRPKSNLRWNKAAGWLSYMISPGESEAGVLVAIDLTGQLIKEVIIRPVTNPRTIGMRFAEGVDWVTSNTVRVWGSFDPSNCEMFDLNVLTGAESNEQFGKCGTFQPSPDGKHIAELGRVNHFTEDGRQHGTVTVDAQLDTQALRYPGDGTEIVVLAGPVWSPDSKQIAVWEKRVSSGESAVIILALSGGTTRTPIPTMELSSGSLEWAGRTVVINREIAVNADTARLSPLTSDAVETLAHFTRARVAADSQAKLTSDLAVKMHWTEVVVLK